MGGGPALNERIAAESGDEGGLADIALTDQEDLSLVVGDGVFKAAQVGGQSFRAALDQLRERLLQRVALHCERQSSLKRASEFPGQADELVAVDVQPSKAGEHGDLGRQAGELISVKM